MLRTKCYEKARESWREHHLLKKEVSFISLGGNTYVVDTPEICSTIEAHCEWCALVKLLGSNKND